MSLYSLVITSFTFHSFNNWNGNKLKNITVILTGVLALTAVAPLAASAAPMSEDKNIYMLRDTDFLIPLLSKSLRSFRFSYRLRFKFFLRLLKLLTFFITN
ncbi:hypothetical protein JOD82_002088 [Paenibacillus sp. 1182]|nr:hypothetical protein [Paenibacillus sp. 1182]